ncbi:MAG: hypothetical protein GVY20_15050 [Bacteroidetes bacterium]|jgi:hypothetical protein|nr:hypothetical protein [Bacteroidota bacterium]
MDRQFYEKVFSTQRMEKYFERHPDNESKAIEHYHLNIDLSESFYSVLSIFEVALRNSLNRELTEHFESKDWHLKIKYVHELNNLNNSIYTAKKRIKNRGENISANKVVAELTLGFWVRLLNAEYERVLWKPLRKAFPYVEKRQRQRNKISAPINKIRGFRNRIFHHEPVSWNLIKLEEMHNTIIMVMSWLNKDLPTIAKRHDRAIDTIEKTKQKLSEI